MKMKKKQSKFHEVFSPTILETQVSDRFVDIINRVGDSVLSDSMYIAKWDWSHKLVGKVTSEVQIPISDILLVRTEHIFGIRWLDVTQNPPLITFI